MNGLELLKQELQVRGYSVTQRNAAVVPAVLDIVANSNGEFTKYDRLERSCQNVIGKTLEWENRLRKAEEALKAVQTEYNEICKDITKARSKQVEETNQYLDRFFEALDSCETAEARDALKRAQMFVNTVDVDTKYDNTAFIIGLASILSNGNVGAIENLKKINKKLTYSQYDY